MRSALLIILLALGALAGCGDAAELSKDDVRTLEASRSDLDDALDTEETLRTSKSEALALRTKVQKIVGQGSFENGGKPDEFGLAALGELRELVPSLVLERGNSVIALDQAATRAFLAKAVSDPPGALYPAAADEVDTIEKIVGGDDVGPDTEIPPSSPGASGNQTVTEYLREAERDVRRVWPSLARRLAAAREEL